MCSKPELIAALKRTVDALDTMCAEADLDVFIEVRQEAKALIEIYTKQEEVKS